MIKMDVYDAAKEFFSGFPFVTVSFDYDVAHDSLDVIFDDGVIPTCILRELSKLQKYLDTHDYNYYLLTIRDGLRLHIYYHHRFIDSE